MSVRCYAIWCTAFMSLIFDQIFPHSWTRYCAQGKVSWYFFRKDWRSCRRLSCWYHRICLRTSKNDFIIFEIVMKYICRDGVTRIMNCWCPSDYAFFLMIPFFAAITAIRIRTLCRRASVIYFYVTYPGIFQNSR